MQFLFRLFVALLTLALAMPPAEAHGRSGGKSGGRPHHHHARSGISVGALFLLPPLLFYDSPAYLYSPPYPGAQPSRFIEQAPEGPQPGTTDRFLCPQLWQEYPDVTECPGGWARIIDLGGPL